MGQLFYLSYLNRPALHLELAYKEYQHVNDLRNMI